MTELKEKLLSQSEIANYLGTTVPTLNTWRATRKYDIPYIKFGNNIKYRLSDVNSWLDKQTCNKKKENKDE